MPIAHAGFGVERAPEGEVMAIWVPQPLTVRHLRILSVPRLVLEVCGILFVVCLFSALGATAPTLMGLIDETSPGLLFAFLMVVQVVYCAYKFVPKYWSPVQIHHVRFELTPNSVRVCMEGMRRELALSRIARVAVVPVPSHVGVGHLVFARKGYPDEEPAIPIEVPEGTVLPEWLWSLLGWASLSRWLRLGQRSSLGTWDKLARGNTTSSVYDQLHEGALTFWLVANPEEVRWEIVQAMAEAKRIGSAP